MKIRDEKTGEHIVFIGTGGGWPGPGVLGKALQFAGARCVIGISLKTNWRKRVRVERTDDIRDAARRF